MTSALDDPDEIAAVFRGTVLDGLSIEEGLGDTWVVTGVDKSQLLPAWRAARAATAQTGRWPVLAMVDGQWLDPEREQIEALEHAARTVDPWAVHQWSGADAHSLIEPDQLHLWLPDFLGQDATQQARQDLRPPTTPVAVQRWTWERLLADPTALEQAWPHTAPYVGTRCWFTPLEGADVVLLPTPVQWLAPAWFDYWGAISLGNRGGDPGRDGLAAAIRQWEQQWGAELVASWGTMLQFVVSRQPALGEQAWQLALQHLAVGGSLETPAWKLALALTRSDAWLLHDRP
ncbi:protein of unknown function [Asanoa ishikariensis]|uniref:DUF4253 domain-containing protein n=1 Tax=Asanoa ishikariensis TaxID=137265 RepID=A0A1H3UMK2_9ACTN|nr:DUF4253 domain-containing protein [Asanoa ishikariensis]SDZ63634.1 protein of unknown function [Asanoa ishikariensis]